MSIQQLTKNAISNACSKGEIASGVALQVVQLKESTNYRIALSDGDFVLSGTCYGEANEMFQKKDIISNSIIIVEEATLTKHKEKFSINLVRCKVLQLTVPDTLGNPEKWTPGSVPAKQAPKPKAVEAPAAPKPVVNKVPTVRNTNKSQIPVRKIEELSNYMTNYAIIARITSKEFIDVMTKKGEKTKKLTLVFSDQSGEIEGQMWGDDAIKWNDKVEMGHVYLVSGGSIKYAYKKYSKTNHPFELSLGRNTTFEESTEDIHSVIGKTVYHFTKLNEIELMNKDATVDVCGLLRNVKPKKQIQLRSGKMSDRRQCTIVDDSNVEMEITLWGKHCDVVNDDDEVVVVIKNANVGEFNGKNLNAGFRSEIKIEPKGIPEADAIRTWFNNGGSTENIRSLQSNSASTGGRRSIIYSDIISSENLGLNGKNDYFDIIANVVSIRGRNCFYLACPNPECKNKKVTQRDDGSFFCDRCNQIIETPAPRYVLSIKLSDFSGSFYTNGMGDEPFLARIMGGMSAADFKEKYDSIQPENPDSMESEVRAQIMLPLLNKQFRFTIRASLDEYNGNQRARLSIVNAKDVNYAEEAKFLAAEILKY